MATRRYTLEQFVHDMTELLEGNADQERIFDRGSSWLERLIQNPQAIPQEMRDSGRGGMLYEAPGGLSVSAVVWRPGAHVDPHDHHTWGMIGIMDNAIHETRFRRVDDGVTPGYARLEKDRLVISKPGEISLLNPGVDEIHQMDNPSDRPTVEIHVYGRSLTGLERCMFDLNTGKVRPYITGRRSTSQSTSPSTSTA